MDTGSTGFSGSAGSVLSARGGVSLGRISGAAVGVAVFSPSSSGLGSTPESITSEDSGVNILLIISPSGVLAKMSNPTTVTALHTIPRQQPPPRMGHKSDLDFGGEAGG